MNIERLVVGQLQTNCYLVFCSETREAVIIDPGDDGDFIIRRIGDLGLKPKMILATHGHFDHVLAVTELKLAFNIPFLMYKKDLFLLKRLRETAKYFLGYDAYPEAMGPGVDRYIKEGDVIEFGKEKLKVIETPGHTPGGVCFYSKHFRGGSSTRRGKPFGFKNSQPEGLKSRRVGHLFSGDTLFRQGIGRTDFSYASHEDLTKSLQKLFKLPSKTIVYPGHGSETDIVSEKVFYL